MGVRKIFIVLIVIVACVLVGALVLNLLLPNVAKTLVNAIEDMVFKATGMSFDWNADGDTGAGNATNSYNQAGDNQNNNQHDVNAGVEGFNNGTAGGGGTP